jgi:ABC-2 type transport system permease protein
MHSAEERDARSPRHPGHLRGDRRRLALVVDTVRAHSVSAAVWVVAGGLTMYGMALAVANEMADFPGGPKALALSISASAEAMRPLRWPAERLDTLGGYLTYHNVILITFILAIYGAVQGARAIRGGEEQHSLEEILATGISRAAVVRDRAVGFAVTMVVISLGLGLGTAAGMAGGGEPDLGGSLISMGISALVAVVGYALGLVASQLMGSARAAAGLSALVLTALYVITNMGEELGPVGAVRFVSPFYYADFSRALVPGYGLDLPATAALVAMAVVLLGLAAVAFARRDYAARLWSRRASATPRPRASRVPSAMLGSIWTESLRRGLSGLLAWVAGSIAIALLMASLEPAVMKVWSSFDFMGAMTGGPGVSPETAYWSFSGELVSPVIAAYAIVQASGWVSDLAEGRVELVLAGPVSWSRLVGERLLALAVGVTLITAGALVGLAIGASAVGRTLDAAALGRLATVCILLGAALGAVAAIVVAWLRRAIAVTVLAVVVGASYLLAYFVPMFGWPDWLNRLSVFWGFGHPYLEWPPASGVVVLVVLALPGALLAAAIAERTPKVA